MATTRTRTKDETVFRGFVVGARIEDSDHEWPEPEGQPAMPRGMLTDEWVGFFIAVDSREASDALNCEAFGSDVVISVGEDEVREYFDVSASDAQEAWVEYARACGVDPDLGRVLFVSGRVP